MKGCFLIIMLFVALLVIVATAEPRIKAVIITLTYTMTRRNENG